MTAHLEYSTQYSTQKVHGSHGVSPDEGKNLIRELEHLTCADRLSVGVVQSAEEKTSERPNSTFMLLKEVTREMERNFLQGPVVIGEGGMTLN